MYFQTKMKMQLGHRMHFRTKHENALGAPNAFTDQNGNALGGTGCIFTLRAVLVSIDWGGLPPARGYKL